MEFDSTEDMPKCVPGLVQSNRPLAEPDLPMLENLLAHLDGVVYRCRADEHWTAEFVSAGCARLFGCRPEEFIGRQRLAADGFILAEDRVRLQREVTEAVPRL